MALQVPITVRANGLGHRSLASRHPKRGIEGVFFYASPYLKRSTTFLPTSSKEPGSRGFPTLPFAWRATARCRQRREWLVFGFYFRFS